MSNFANLKKSSNLDKLTKAIEQINSNQNNNNQKDENSWRPEVDKVGNGYAVIRFLPAPEVDGDDGLPWVKIYNHGFQGPGGWYIENSLTTLNQSDPVGEYNTQLWNSGIEANKDIARKQKRRLNYISNVLVIEDPKHPENEGKVVLYRYGKKIFDKLTEAMNPQFEDEKAMNPFDMWTGANFKLKIRKVDGFANYDKSEFESPSAIGDEDKMEKLWKSEFSLTAFLDGKNFKSYDELKAKMNKVLGTMSVTTKAGTAEEAPATIKTPEYKDPVTDDSDDMAYFNALASDD